DKVVDLRLLWFIRVLGIIDHFRELGARFRRFERYAAFVCDWQHARERDDLGPIEPARQIDERRRLVCYGQNARELDFVPDHLIRFRIARPTINAGRLDEKLRPLRIDTRRPGPVEIEEKAE